MSNLAEVVTLYENNASNVTAMLRRLADSIEAGEEVATEACVVVQFHEDGSVKVFGMGKTDCTTSIGILEIGKAFLTRMMLSATPE